MADDKKKKIFATSKGTYRGVLIYEVPTGFGFFLGVWFHKFPALQEATAYIDHWFDLRKN